MKKFIRSKYAPLLIIAVQVLITAAVYRWIPDEMPMQFNASGGVNWSMPKVLGAWTLPALSGVVAAMGILKPDSSRGSIWFAVIVMAIINISFLAFIILR